ncbi:MAG: starch-binding protein, partial [Prevotella sp.]|nr:starch-binding protein [Prevotella sp.]
MKKVLSILALLLMAVTGAWADDTYTVQFRANGNTKTVENVVLPHQFQCSYNYENGELDQIIKELYGLSAGYCLGEINPCSNENVTCGVSGYDDYITISAPFEGTATVTGTYYLDDDDGNTLDYFLEISIPGYTEPAAAIFAIDTDGSTQDFGSVELDATAQKTFTITNSGNKSLYVTISNPEDFTAEMTHNANVYFTDALGWGDIHVYYWNNGPEWPGAAMTELYTNEYGQKVYYCELPADVEGIIFNGNGNQTVDIKDEPIGKAYYTKDEKEGNNYTVGTWSYDNCVPAGMSRVLTVAMNTATLGSKSGNITLSFDAKNATSFTIPCTGETVAPATKYDLTLAEVSSDHGTVAFTVGGNAATQAKKDDVVTVSVTPNEGYSAKDVTVRGYTSWEAASDVLTGGGDNPGLVSDINVTKQENGTWTFTMPEANVWVTVSYAADKTALNDAITDAETYYNSIKDDHADAAAALQSAINTAKGVQDNADATKEDVDDAIAALATAKTTAEGAVLTETKNELNDDITEAEAYYNSISESNPDAAAALLEAINAAKAVKDNADATQEEVETAEQTLTDALNAAKADVALKRITLTIPAKSFMARIDADKRQIENAVDGVNLYSVKSVTNTEVVLTDELSVIAAEMPYFIYNDNDTEVEVSIIVSSEDADNVDYDSEHFKGTLVD